MTGRGLSPHSRREHSPFNGAVLKSHSMIASPLRSENPAPSPEPLQRQRVERRVAITAAGIVSPLGIGLEENREALLCSRSGIGPVTGFDVSTCRSKTAGEVDEARLRASVGGAAARFHRSSLMMIAAMREVMAGDALCEPEALVIGTTSGGMSFGEAFYRSLLKEDRPGRKQHPAWLANYSPLKAVLDAAREAGDWGRGGKSGGGLTCQIVANACASGSNAIGHAFQLIRSGLRQRLVAGGYDSISELVFTGFDSLQASTPELVRPFDKNRSGLVLGEGAALFALEEWGSAVRRGAPILGEVIGYGISTDNHHLTQPHPSGIGPLLAMQRALESAGALPSSIDYINAHGTATPFNDATEGAAIEQLFGAGRVPVSSTKGMMGHSLGAAGAVEALFSLLAIRHGFLPPNVNYNEPDPQWSLDIVANHARPAGVRRVVSNSFGFGGTNASIVLQKGEL